MGLEAKCTIGKVDHVLPEMCEATCRLQNLTKVRPVTQSKLQSLLVPCKAEVAVGCKS